MNPWDKAFLFFVAGLAVFLAGVGFGLIVGSVLP